MVFAVDELVGARSHVVFGGSMPIYIRTYTTYRCTYVEPDFST